MCVNLSAWLICCMPAAQALDASGGVLRAGHPSRPRMEKDCKLLCSVEGFMRRCACCAGIDADGLPPDLQCHHLFVNSWENLDAPQARMLPCCPPLWHLCSGSGCIVCNSVVWVII